MYVCKPGYVHPAGEKDCAMSARLVLKLILLRPRVASFESWSRRSKLKEPTDTILNTSGSANVAFRFLFPRESKIHRLFA